MTPPVNPNCLAYFRTSVEYLADLTYFIFLTNIIIIIISMIQNQHTVSPPGTLIKYLLNDSVSLGNGIFILFPTQTYKFPLRRAKKTQTKHFRIIGGFLWRTAEPATAQRGQKPSGK